MRNGVSSYKQYCRLPAVSRRRVTLTVALAAALLTGAWQGLDSGLPGEPSPALARLFTPPHAPAGSYDVRVLRGGIAQARQALWDAVNGGTTGGTGAESWRIQELDPLDVFGETGTYPRTRVARLYTGRRASVVRVPIERHGSTMAAVTLVSPYPDPTISRLEPGTMIIVLHLPVK